MARGRLLCSCFKAILFPLGNSNNKPTVLLLDICQCHFPCQVKESLLQNMQFLLRKKLYVLLCRWPTCIGKNLYGVRLHKMLSYHGYTPLVQHYCTQSSLRKCTLYGFVSQTQSNYNRGSIALAFKIKGILAKVAHCMPVDHFICYSFLLMQKKLFINKCF